LLQLSGTTLEAIEHLACGGAATSAVAAPYVLRAHAQANADIAPYQQAKINWRQAEGEEATS